MLDAANIGRHYHELIEMIVCDTKSRECMIHRCTKCPGTANIQSIMISTFLEQDAGINEADQELADPSAETICYKQWTVIGRS